MKPVVLTLVEEGKTQLVSRENNRQIQNLGCCKQDKSHGGYKEKVLIWGTFSFLSDVFSDHIHVIKPLCNMLKII